MRVIITPYVLISAVAALVAAVVALIAWRRRTAPGGRPLAALMVAVAIWSAGAAAEYATIGIPGKLFWAKVQYVGVVSSPVFFLLLALEYNRLDQWLTRRTVALLFVVPAVTLLMALTNERHGLLWPTITPIGAPEENLALYTHGIGFWIGSVGYGYLLMLIGTGLLVRAALRFPAPYRRQAAMLIVAALAPWLVNIVYVAGFSPAPGLELTPLVLVFTGSVFAWSILRLRLLDLVPVARGKLIETMEAGMVVLDAQGRLVDINPAARTYIGASTPAQLGDPAATVFAGWPEWRACCEALRTGRVEISLHEGTQRTLELSFSPIYDRHGHYSGRLVVIHDISERKAAQTEIESLNRDLEARVAQRTQDLAASEERFREVLSSITDHVFALQVAADGSVSRIFSSPRLPEMTGFAQGELSGGFFALLEQITHPEDYDAVLAFFYHVLEAGAGELEYRWLCADQRVVWVRTSMRVRVDGNEKTLFGVTSDITARKQVEQAVLDMRALAELDRLRSELISNVSHELRTPLGLIKAASTTLQRGDVTFAPATQQQLLQGITDETGRLEHLVANLLDIAQLEQDRFILQWDQVELTQLIAGQVSLVQGHLAHAGVTNLRFDVHLPAAPVAIAGDAARLEQVLRNLVENAIRYSPDGGTITVALEADAESCQIQVADQGIGIAPQEQAHIFDRFYRAHDDRVRRIRGTGLGLSICREIVEAHHGTLSVCSKPGEGATFVVWLPNHP